MAGCLWIIIATKLRAAGGWIVPVTPGTNCAVDPPISEGL